MNIDWKAVQQSFSNAWDDIVAFRGAHPVVAAAAVAFASGWLVAFCTFKG